MFIQQKFIEESFGKKISFTKKGSPETSLFLSEHRVYKGETLKPYRDRA